MNIFVDLFLTFSKVGCFTFGGGYAMISLIEDICVRKKQWISHDEMMNVTVIAESTPGPIAINCATFVGFKQAGLPGAVFATLGIVLPSIIIILLISKLIDNFMDIAWVSHAFKGIKLAVAILIIDAGVTMITKMKGALLPRVIVCASLGVMLLSNLFSWNISSVVLMIVCAAVSLAVFKIKGAGAKGGREKQ